MSQSYRDHVHQLANNALTIFYRTVNATTGRRQFLSEVKVIDHTSSVTVSNYSPTEYCVRKPANCNPASWTSAEPLMIFLYLYANWTDYGGSEARNEIWSDWLKYARLAYFTYKNHRIPVEKREYFIADELFKYLFLPYLDSPVCNRLYVNAQRVVTLYSKINGYPGLFGRSLNVMKSYETDWKIMYPGIQELSFNKPDRHNAVMPHAAFPLMLHPESRSYGIVWYANMLNSTRSQTTVGALDAIEMTGKINLLF